MAMSATISVLPTTATINEPVVATLVITNGGSSAVNMTAVNPEVRITGGALSSGQAAAVGVVPFGPGSVTSVAASGTLTVSFGLRFFSPSTGPIGAGMNTWDVLAQCYSNDGSVFAPTAATITVNPISLPSTEQ